MKHRVKHAILHRFLLLFMTSDESWLVPKKKEKEEEKKKKMSAMFIETIFVKPKVFAGKAQIIVANVL